MTHSRWFNYDNFEFLTDNVVLTARNAHLMSSIKKLGGVWGKDKSIIIAQLS